MFYYEIVRLLDSVVRLLGTLSGTEQTLNRQMGKTFVRLQGL